jgi:hypothetical protein
MPNVMGREFPYTPEGMAASQQYAQSMGMRDGGPMGFRPVGMGIGGTVFKILEESGKYPALFQQLSGQEAQGPKSPPPGNAFFAANPDRYAPSTDSWALDSFRSEFGREPRDTAELQEYMMSGGGAATEMRDGGPMGFRPVGMFLGGIVRRILAEREGVLEAKSDSQEAQEAQGSNAFFAANPDRYTPSTDSWALSSFRSEFGREPESQNELANYMEVAGGTATEMRDGGMMGFRPIGMARGGGPMELHTQYSDLAGSLYEGHNPPREGPRGAPPKGYDDPDSEYYYGDEKMAEYAEGKRLADLRRAQPGYYDLPTEQERAQGPVQLDLPSLQEQLDVEPASAPTGSTDSLALDSFRREFEREPRDIAELQEYMISRAGSPRLMRDGGMMGFRPLGMQAGGVPVADVAPDVRAIFQGLVDATQSGSTQDVAAYIESNRQDLNDMVSMMMLPQGQADFITNTINSFAPPPVPQRNTPPQGMSDFPGYEPGTGDFYSPQQEDTMPPDGYLADPGFSMSPPPAATGSTDPGFSMSPPPAATGSTDPGFSMSPPPIPDYGVDNIGMAGGGLMSLRRR